jgi:hypothetical protein
MSLIRGFDPWPYRLPLSSFQRRLIIPISSKGLSRTTTHVCDPTIADARCLTHLVPAHAQEEAVLHHPKADADRCGGDFGRHRQGEGVFRSIEEGLKSGRLEIMGIGTKIE